MIHFGNRLKKVMEEKKVKQIDLANAMDTTPQNLSKIFNKEHLGTEILLKASEFLKVPLTAFLENDYPTWINEGKKPKVVLELHLDEIISIDVKNRKLEIVKK